MTFRLLQVLCVAGLIGAVFLLIDGRQLAAVTLGIIFGAVLVYASQQTTQDRNLHP